MDDDPLARLLANSERRTAQAEAYVAMLTRHHQQNKAARLIYRCPRNCVLCRVYVTAQGVVVYFPRYRLSPAANAETSNTDGRATNTLDGERRWKERTRFLDQVVDAPVICDHLRSVLPNVRIEADLAGTRREITVSA